MAEERQFRTNQGQVITTTLSNEQAIELCRNSSNTMIKDLIYQYDNRHRRKRGLSEAQWAWVHKTANNQHNNHQGTPILAVQQIVALFDRVRNSIQYPKIRLNIKPDNKRGIPGDEIATFPLVLASAQLKILVDNTRVEDTVSENGNTTAVNVTDGAPFGRSIWYGRIDLSGRFFKSTRCYGETEENVVNILSRFAADPAGTAAEHGRLNQRCSFCDGPLVDNRSKIVGFGPVCAMDYQIPWGDYQFPDVSSQSSQPSQNNTVGDDAEDRFDRMIQENDMLDSELAAIAKLKRDKH